MKIYALCHPETREVGHVGYVVHRDLTKKLSRRAYGWAVKKWMDELPGPPLVVILDDEPDGTYARLGRWLRQLRGTVLPERPVLRPRRKMRSRWDNPAPV